MSDQQLISVPIDNENRRSHRFARQYVDPWTQAYVTQDDIILVRVWTPLLTSTVNVSLRYQGVNGEIRPEFFTQSIGATASSFATIKIQGSEGYLISATVECPGTIRGQCFISLELQRGQGSQDATFGQLLISGYPGSNQRIGYPQTPCYSPLDGRGAMKSNITGSPAAGADWSQAVPSGVNWILRSIGAQLVTSASVATRSVVLNIKDGGGNIILQSAASITQAASLTFEYSFFNGAFSAAGPAAAQGGLPAEFRLLAGWTISVTTTNIQAGDQWSAIRQAVEEYVAT